MSSSALTSSRSLQISLGSTPVKKKSGSTPSNAPRLGHRDIKEAMARELEDEIVGGMPVREFFSQFLAVDEQHLPAVLSSISDTYFDGVPSRSKSVAEAKAKEEEKTSFVEDDLEDDPEEEEEILPSGIPEPPPVTAEEKEKRKQRRVKEKDMYAKLASLQIALIRESKVLGDKLDAFDTSGSPDKDSKKDWKPDISFYETDALRRYEESKKKARRTSPASEIVKPNLFDIQELPAEIKVSGESRPFQDAGDDLTGEELRNFKFQPDTDTGRQFRGQLATVLTELCARQHRTHAFMLFIGDPSTRLIRADRTGVIVSRAFNFRTEGKVFAEFLWRFSQLTRAGRGFDETVLPASDSQAALAKEKLHSWKPPHPYRRPVVVIKVPDGDSEREVLAWGALSEPESLTGRATRGYPVYDIKGKKIRFLKDTWRSEAEGMLKEIEVLKELDKAGVHNIPKVTCGGDVPNHKTLTQDYLDRGWAIAKSKQLTTRIHHRILEDFIPCHINDFDNPKAMVTAISHAFIAHEEAYEYGILHRDISDNNVRITKNGDGILTDWDLAIRVKTPNGQPIEPMKARQRYRTGTWYFMSSALLRLSTKLHNLQDDLESFFYLVLYLSLSKLPFTTKVARSKRAIIDGVFAQCTFDEVLGTYIGGSEKYMLIRNLPNSCIAGLVFDDNKPLTDFLMSTIDALEEYYDHSRAVEKAIANKTKTERLKEDFETLNLRDHAYLQHLFEKALGEVGWPDNKLPTSIPKVPVSPHHPRNAGKRRAKRRDSDDFELQSEKKSKTASGSTPATRSSTRCQAQSGGSQPSISRG